MRRLLHIAIFLSISVGPMGAAQAETDAEKLVAKAKLGSLEAQVELGQAYREGFQTDRSGHEGESER